MKAKFVLESLEDDKVPYQDENLDTDTEVIDEPINVETFTDEDDNDLVITNNLEKAFDNQLKIPEYARQPVSFKVRGKGLIVDAVPMAKMRDGSFLMKIGDKYRKFKMEDIIED